MQKNGNVCGALPCVYYNYCKRRTNEFKMGLPYSFGNQMVTQVYLSCGATINIYNHMRY